MATKITIQDRELIINIAKLYLDTPYIFGCNGTLPGEPLDCSRFTQIILENVGITLERNSAMQGEQFSSTGNMIGDLNKAEIGDLIFFKNTYESQNEITHVGFYLGNNEMISASGKKVNISKLDKYRQEHFKGIGKLSLFTAQYNKSLAQKNYKKLSNKDLVQYEKTIKAINAVIAVLTSTWGDLPEKYQAISADYAKQLRNQYPEARKLESEQTKKIYQSVVDMLSYARKFAGREEQKKYEELNQYLRKKFGLQ